MRLVRVSQDGQGHPVAGFQVDGDELIKRSGANELSGRFHGQILHVFSRIQTPAVRFWFQPASSNDGRRKSGGARQTGRPQPARERNECCYERAAADTSACAPRIEAAYADWPSDTDFESPSKSPSEIARSVVSTWASPVCTLALWFANEPGAGF